MQFAFASSKLDSPRGPDGEFFTGDLHIMPPVDWQRRVNQKMADGRRQGAGHGKCAQLGDDSPAGWAARDSSRKQLDDNRRLLRAARSNTDERRASHLRMAAEDG